MRSIRPGENLAGSEQIYTLVASYQTKIKSSGFLAPEEVQPRVGALRQMFLCAELAYFLNIIPSKKILAMPGSFVALGFLPPPRNLWQLLLRSWEAGLVKKRLAFSCQSPASPFLTAGRKEIQNSHRTQQLWRKALAYAAVCFLLY